MTAKPCKCKAIPYCTWRNPDISTTFPLEPQVKTYVCTNDLPCANHCDNCAYQEEYLVAREVLGAGSGEKKEGDKP
jgi:hypothetical protein